MDIPEPTIPEAPLPDNNLTHKPPIEIRIKEVDFWSKLLSIFTILLFAGSIASVWYSNRTLNEVKKEFVIAHKTIIVIESAHLENYGILDNKVNSAGIIERRNISVAYKLIAFGDAPLQIDRMMNRFYFDSAKWCAPLSELEKGFPIDTADGIYINKDAPRRNQFFTGYYFKDKNDSANCSSGNNLLFIEVQYTNLYTLERLKYYVTLRINPLDGTIIRSYKNHNEVIKEDED